jgi:3-hydroxyisobutyrate dehydrogenase
MRAFMQRELAVPRQNAQVSMRLRKWRSASNQKYRHHRDAVDAAFRGELLTAAGAFGACYKPRMIAFLGMGLLGSNFARAALRRGEQVSVWNRTAARARALEADGVRVFTDPADAVRGASRVHIAVSDDAVVEAVLAQAEPGFEPGAIIIDHTTTSPDGARARYERFRGRPQAFQHAPVFMGPQNALEASGTMLISGDAAQVERLRPALEKMTGKLVYLGSEPERAAKFKLLGNLFLIFMTAGVGEMLSLGKALGVTAEDTVQLFDMFNPGLTLPARAARVLTANAAPSWELQMARKDARLMLEAADAAAVPLATLPSIAALMDRFIARGRAHDDWTVIARAALER